MVRKEIGSEFWNVPVAGENGIFPNETKWFVSGRSALSAIIKENHFETVAIPKWCCESMVKPFVDAGIEVSFYDDNPGTADAVIVMDYFGYSTERDYSKWHGTVIRDVTHSLFSKTYSDADYYFGSLRKWAGFWTGGFAWGFREKVRHTATGRIYTNLRMDAMKAKEEYINYKTNSKEYLQIFAGAEEHLENIGVACGDERDILLAKNLDVEFIRERRHKNAQILLANLKKYAIFKELKSTDCPMFVPIRISERDTLRKYLIQNDIFCPIHWPISGYHDLDMETKKLYDEELSVVCDQRYSEEDMERINTMINIFLAERK